jgi:tRNA A37 N6-isopentenylltransferase MiaA
MLVGGSMLYLSSVIDGLKPLPSDPALRAKLQKIYDQDEGVTLQKELMHLDPESGASVERRNAVYLIRAVEICRLAHPPRRHYLRHIRPGGRCARRSAERARAPRAHPGR